MQTAVNHATDPLALTRSSNSDGTVHLAASGEIDIANVGRLRTTIVTIFSEPTTRRLTLDLAGLNYIDSMGVSALIFGARLGQQRGIAFSIASPQGHVLRVLKILGLYETLTAGA